jgi:hypothetical protein
MALTLEDLDRRVTALELAETARGGNAIVRLEQKVDALPRGMAEMMTQMIAESEDRLREAFGISSDACERRMRELINTVVSTAEQRTAGRINDSEQRILVALDRLTNP